MGYTYKIFKEKDNLVNFPEKRECYDQLSRYINGKHPENKVCVLFGLRRTGKTTMINQCIQDMPRKQKEKTISIYCDNETDFMDVKMFIMRKIDEGYKYFFVDEITKTEDFQKLGSVLSDFFVTMEGAKIVLAGTDSLGFITVSKDELYDRINFINTTYIPFPEYSRLTGEKNILNYIKKGSTLDGKAFNNQKTSQEYIETAVIDNIINSLEKSGEAHEFPIPLTEVYSKKILKSTIHKMINLYPQRIVLKGLNKKFKSSPVSSAKQILTDKSKAKENFTEIIPFEDKINDRLKELLDIDEKYQVSDDDVKEIKQCLYDVGLIETVENVFIDEKNQIIKRGDMELLCYPGLYHANISYSLSELKKEENWEEAEEDIIDKYIKKALEWAEGKILENAILCDTNHIIGNKYKVFKLDCSGDNWAEVDMVIQNPETKNLLLFEIKRSDQIDSDQEKHLINEKFMNITEKLIGKISGKYVLYNGETKNQFIPRLSISEFLNSIYDDSKQQSFDVERTIKNMLDDGTKIKKNIEASIQRIDKVEKELSKHNVKSIDRR